MLPVGIGSVTKEPGGSRRAERNEEAIEEVAVRDPVLAHLVALVGPIGHRLAQLRRAQRRSPAAGGVNGVPWWGVVSSVVAPVLLVSGWTIAAGFQRGSYNAVADTVSALAGDAAADRWLMTLAFLAAGACEVMTGLALRPAASAGRLVLMMGGLAGLLVAASPEPAGGGGSVRHTFGAVAGLLALAAWPIAAQRRGPSVPWGLRPVVSAGVSVVLLGVLLWFGAELVTSGGQAGLAERLLGGMQTLWPVLVILSCCLTQSRNHTPVTGGVRNTAGPP
jgi:hypothetical protein